MKDKFDIIFFVFVFVTIFGLAFIASDCLKYEACVYSNECAERMFDNG